MGIGRGSSSSKRVRVLHSKNSKKGCSDVSKTLNSKGIRDFRAKAQIALQLKIAGEFSSVQVINNFERC